MAAIDNIQEQLFDDSVGRLTPEQEAQSRREILTSHGNKNPALIEHIAQDTSIPTSDLHTLHNKSINIMTDSDMRDYPQASGFSEAPIIDDGTPASIGIHPLMATGHLSKYGPRTVAHEIGHAMHSGRLPTSRVENIPTGILRNLKYPASEGSAEGYSARYTAPDAPHSSMYTPEFFSQSMNTRWQTPHGPELFSRAHSWTQSTGQGLDISDFRRIKDISHVLASDYDKDSYGDEVSTRNDVGNTPIDVGHRMAINEIDRRDPSVKTPKFEDERRKRDMVINGQYVQGSLMPDLVPETNQYGDTPVDPSELAPSSWGKHMQFKKKQSEDRFQRWATEQRRPRSGKQD